MSFTFSCHKLLINTVYSNQCHSVFTFSDSFNTPNVTVTGVIWEAICLWWKHLLHHDIFICLPSNRTRKVSARLFTHVWHEFWRLASSCRGRLSTGNLQGHTPLELGWAPSTRATSKPSALFKIITSVTIVRYFWAAPLGLHVCFRRHTSCWWERWAQQYALSQCVCVWGMPRKLASCWSQNIIISFKHLCDIIMSLKTFTNIYIL